MTSKSTNNEPSQSIYVEAITSIQKALEEAKHLHIPMANTAILATVNAHSQPSTRTITICDVNEDGLLLFVNKTSGKAKQMNQNPNVGLCFYWHDLHLQLVLQGTAKTIDASEANTWWGRQDRHFQLAAWASNKDDTVTSEQEKQRRRAFTREQFADERVPMPDHWIAYRIEPYRIDFWEANWKRASTHYCYEKKDQLWEKHLL
jgi:pyridoxamine 5'-phosphate oxidase